MLFIIVCRIVRTFLNNFLDFDSIIVEARSSCVTKKLKKDLSKQEIKIKSIDFQMLSKFFAMLFYNKDVPFYLYLFDNLLTPFIKIFLKLFSTIQFSILGNLFKL
jgi:hypothetical protein